MAERTVTLTGCHRLTSLAEGETIITVLYRVASAVPHRPALLTRGFGRSRTKQISYAQLLEHVERVAEVLTLCGVRRGETIALQVPNCWGSAALMLACFRIGAVVVPVHPGVDEDGLERVLAGTGACACVVFDTYLGQRNAERLLTVSERLPALRHRIVLGDAAATGALDFDQLYRDRAGLWLPEGERLGPPPRDTDGPCLSVPAIGPTSVTLTHYRHWDLCADAFLSMHALADVLAGRDKRPLQPPGEVFGTSYPITEPSGLMPLLWQPLLTGGTGVSTDRWAPDECLDLFGEAGVTMMLCPAEHWEQLLEEQRLRPRPLPHLHTAALHTTAVPPELAAGVEEAFGVPLRPMPFQQAAGDR
ncbi:hypothetical protein GCM10009716_15030 [Streptomyces sodiiphilus]|uniref:AMP-dependent synthetase/ligase domain-containing protein n=1 Tax=Streptomyces sodiiphilus TaxID=226217 RepID=A0ABP5A8I5_9ACTN